MKRITIIDSQTGPTPYVVAYNPTTPYVVAYRAF